jgi:hypothetical protein
VAARAVAAASSACRRATRARARFAPATRRALASALDFAEVLDAGDADFDAGVLCEVGRRPGDDVDGELLEPEPDDELDVVELVRGEEVDADWPAGVEAVRGFGVGAARTGAGSGAGSGVGPPAARHAGASARAPITAIAARPARRGVSMLRTALKRWRLNVPNPAFCLLPTPARSV